MSSTSNKFELCDSTSIGKAMSIIAELHSNNQSDKRYYKSLQSLNCTIEDLQRSFYFLFDCINFCTKETKIHNNLEYQQSLEVLQSIMMLTYLGVEPDDIPFELRGNLAFGKHFELDKNLDERELSYLELITWRKKEHWSYYAIAYGLESKLGQYCAKKASE